MFIKNKIAAALIITSAVALSACQPDTIFTSDQPIEDSAAHFLTSNTLVIKMANGAEKLKLVSENRLGEEVVIELTPTVLNPELQKQYPHLAQFSAFTFDEKLDFNALVKSINIVKSFKDGNLIAKSYVQQARLLDDLFTRGKNDANEVKDLGSSLTSDGVSFKLWAPTAANVSVHLFDKNKTALSDDPIELKEDLKTGVWSLTTKLASHGTYYQYQVEVFHPRTGKYETLITTDPYSLSLSVNSKYSQVVDLNAPETKPAGWAQHKVPTVEAPEDLILYETHIRDFSAFDTKLSSASYRGKYKAFSERNSDGMSHLMELKGAGLNTVHLLPTYDLSTINEDPAQAIDLSDSMAKVCDLVDNLTVCDEDVKDKSLNELLSSYDPRSDKAQGLMEKIRGYDNYNWGYDPYHYTVPEGSYAVDPEGFSRLVEFREMVMSLHNKGFRVIMDVVYNHTFASGVAEKSVLDKVVPNYYHRYDPVTGVLETSTCCDNSATENAMMEKLMTDSLVTWAQQYKIDGFRFDLMGHQPKDAMIRSREAVVKVDSDTYFYGEGWNFGEVANNRQFVQASQTELAGTEIGTFTDRLRDAIRGGNFQTAKEGLRHDQGVGNGLTVVPNDLQDKDLQIDEYLRSMDQVKLGLAANLAGYSMVNSFGTTVLGKDIPYGGGPAGYAKDPADTINYVSKHDNQTLWDNNQYRLPYDLTTDQRVRFQLLSLSYPLMAQGIPFLHMGSELLRSKSFLRDSYDYGDWFNRVDFSYQTNNYNVGLPPAEKDVDNWPIISTLLDKNEGRDQVQSKHIQLSSKVFQDFIKIRMSSKLFRLRTADQVKHQVTFLNQDVLENRGLIVMYIADNGLTEIDPTLESIVVVFNNTAEPKTFSTDASNYLLHEAQVNGADEVVKKAKATETGFEVPGLTTAVFVKAQ
ncbi:pullulanase-type alpha-1,6-glucosidase [Psychrosphaera haliotis]|nr:pullulanase-type alpha-1,6-glucosidase [Psychrosphaera haliotis]